MRLFYVIVFLLSISSSSAQIVSAEISSSSSDSILTYGWYLAAVKAFHPVSVNANLELDLAARNLRMARGGFDPLLYGNYRTKEFKETDYYDALQAGLEIPTWFGLSLQAGFEDNSGVFLNPELTVPSRGLINAGLTAQLGAGLLMDSRRAALRQAQIGLDMGDVQRLLLLNNLYAEANAAYFQWALADRSLRVAENAVGLADTRYDAVKISYRFGDVPAIDTVEAYTQVLDRLYRLRQAQTDWVEAVNLVSVYLWDASGNPFDMPPGVRPQVLDSLVGLDFDLVLDIDPSHPELLKVQLKRSSLNIDRRLAAEYLRPKIELKYNFLSENISPAPVDDYFGESVFFQNNYNFGAKVSFPLFIREARGKVGMTKIKIDMIDQDFELKQASLNAKLNSTFVKLANLRDQVGFYTQNVGLLERLLEGERQLFINGESSLFLINARETKVIDSQNILNELIAKELALRAQIRALAGEGFIE